MNRFTRSIAMASARHPWRTIATWVLVLGAVFALAGSGGGAFIDDFSAKGSQSERALQLLEDKFPEAAQGHGARRLRGRGRRDAAGPAAGRRRGAGRRRRGRPRRVRGRPLRGRHHLGRRPDRVRRAHPRRDAGRAGQAGLRAPHGAGRRVEHRRPPGRARRRRRVPQRRGRDLGRSRASASWSRCSCCWSCSGPSWPPLVPIGLALVAVGAGIGGIIAARRRHGRLAVGDPDRGHGRAGRRHRLRPVHRRPLPGEPRRRSGQPHRPGRRDGLLRMRRSSSPAAPWSSRWPPSPSPASASSPRSAWPPRIVVLSAVAAAITLLPALLGLLGDRIDTGRLVRRHRPAKRAEDTAWWRFAHRVSGRPWPYLVGAVVALLAFAAPALGDADRLPGRGRRPGRHDAPTGLRPARPRASAPGSTGRCWSSSTSTAPASTPPTCPALAEDIARRSRASPRSASRRPPRTATPWSSRRCRRRVPPTPRPPSPSTEVRDVHPRQRLRLRASPR